MAGEWGLGCENHPPGQIDSAMSNVSDEPHERQTNKRNVLEDLETRLPEAPEEVLRKALDGDVLSALAVAAAKEPGKYQKFLLNLREAGTKAKDIDALKQAVKDQRRLRVVTSDERPEMTKAGDELDDAPMPEQIIPEPYFIGPGATGYRKTTQDGTVTVRIAHAPVLITRTFRNVVDRTISLELAWRANRKWNSKTVDRGVALNARKLVELASDGFPVSSGTAPKLVEYLQELEAANRW